MVVLRLDNRGIHDMIAQTKVIDLKIEKEKVESAEKEKTAKVELIQKNSNKKKVKKLKNAKYKK